MTLGLAAISEMAQASAESEISLREIVLEQNKTKKNQSQKEIDRLFYNHCINQTEFQKLSGLSKVTFRDRLESAIKEGIIGEPFLSGRRKLYSLFQVEAMLDYLNIPSWSDHHQSGQVIVVQNHKGGTGKTTTAVSLATAIALEQNERAKVCLIDLDPQGSVAQLLVDIDENDEEQIFLTAVDLMLGEMEIERGDSTSEYQMLAANGYEHDEMLQLAPIRTHSPNLDIMPAFPKDDRFTGEAWADPNGNYTRYLSLFKTKVIESLKQHYDIIIVDTPPQDSPLVWAAFEAADGLLIPITPHKLDYLSSTRYLQNIGRRIQSLPSVGTNLTWAKVIAVNYDDENDRDKEIFDLMRRNFREHLFINLIKRSAAFEAAARNYRTVLDIRKSEELTPDLQLDKAQTSVTNAANELLNILKTQRPEAK